MNLKTIKVVSGSTRIEDGNPVDAECFCQIEAHGVHHNTIPDKLRGAFTALEQIKLWCLTTKDPAPRALGHVVRLCIDAGVTDKLDTLQQRENLRSSASICG